MLEVTVKIEGFDEEGNPSESVQSEIIDGVVRALAGKIENAVMVEVKDRFRASVTASLEKCIESYLTKPIIPTNIYGEKKGEPETLTEHIVRTGIEWLKEEVNQHGRRPDYNDSKLPRAGYIATKLADEQLQKALKPAIDKAVADAKDFMATKVTTALKTAMAAAIK